MAEAHRRHGRLAWRRLFAPAIRLARDGFVSDSRASISSSTAIGSMQSCRPNSANCNISPPAEPLSAAESRALYYGADGAPLRVGTVIRNPATGRDACKLLATKGPRAFYTGANAAAIARTVSTAPRNPAPMTVSDLAAYKAKPRLAALCAKYRGYRLCGMGPPSSSGATTVFGILGLMERFDMAALGKDSPVAWHLLAEAERLAYADRERYLADADFVPVPDSRPARAGLSRRPARS